MPTFQGQTDQVLRIQVQSILVGVAWQSNAVAAGGMATIEVLTAYVGEGAPIQLTVKDQAGSTLMTLSGSVHSNLHRSQIVIPRDCKAKTLIVEAEMAKHGLQGKSELLTVFPTPVFTDLKWTDGQGKTVTTILPETLVACEAKVTGLSNDQKVLVSVYQQREHGRTLLLSADAEVLQGSIRLLWNQSAIPGPEKIVIQKDLNREGGHYHAPEYVFIVSALGVASESAMVKQATWIHYDLGPNPDAGKTRTGLFESPDGKQGEESIPEDGQLRLAQMLPGHLIFKGLKNG
jgi:hypothetical protein